MTDPWLDQNAKELNKSEVSVSEASQRDSIDTTTEDFGFEDNFSPSETAAKLDNETQANSAKNNCNEHQSLPDSASYLLGLERKLENIKKSAKLVDALAAKRDDSLRAFLQDDSPISGLNNNAILELDTPISNGESTVQEIYRHLQPVQAVTLGETVHIVEYDQLGQEILGIRAALEESDESESH